MQADTTAFAAGAGPLQPIDQAGLAPALSDATNFRRARLRLEGDGQKQESALSTQIIRQVRMELEEVLQLLKR